jgi:formylglycine-generating enzyme required for sulfatase activity/tRNA A-37 threonylcarbamoyl transferase component Bud32
MSYYCLNPNCQSPQNPEGAKFCLKCKESLSSLLGRYRPNDALAKGAFGKTFMAVDEAKPSKPLCVIKQFAPKDPTSASIALRLFQREAEQLDRLGKHPQIPELMAHFEQDQRQYIVQEFVDGQNLKDELKSRGKLFNEVEIIQLLRDLLPVLNFIHGSGVIHRDIKPDNIIRRAWDQSLFLIDFGAAKHAVSESALAAPGTVIGTPHYDAPEQAVGQSTFASDIYGIAATCIHLMTGESPNYRLYSHAEGGWVWQQFIKSPVSEQLVEILNKMLARELKHRFKTSTEVLQALQTLPTTGSLGSTFGIVSALINPISPIVDPIAHVKTQPKRANRSKSLSTSSSLPIFELKNFQFQVATVAPKQTGIFGLVTTCEVFKVAKEAEFFTGYIGMGRTFEMVFIPGGAFQMGSPKSESDRQVHESPQHLVKITPFFMGKYPVTQEQWDMVVTLPKVVRELKSAPSNFKGLNRPVERVSWYDAIEFCARLSKKMGQIYRLPSESEWEYACRAGTTTPFHFGMTITSDLANYNGEQVYSFGGKGKNRRETSSVGSFQVANAFGLYDMHGNVWEWCADPWHENYNGKPDDGVVWENDSDEDTAIYEADGTISHYNAEENLADNGYRVLRGGSWGNDPWDCRSACRLKDLPTSEYSDYGFRIVCS